MIRVGTCGFSFKDWKGTAYPGNIKNSQMLDYYSRVLGFDTVEIDAGYYGLIQTKTVSRWAHDTPEGFLFAIKCHRDITLNSKSPVDPRNADNGALIKTFIESFQPVIQSKKTLTFLAQFGPVFFNHQSNKDYILKLKDYFKDLPLTVEFRHSSWLSPDNRKETFNFLKNNGIGYAVADEPALRSLAPFIPEATNSTGYIRLHGRNKKWFEGDSSTRYDYLYSDRELSEFIPFIRGLESRTAITSVFFNNCHAGAALKNAVKLRQMLNLVPSFKANSNNRNTDEQLTLDLD